MNPGPLMSTALERGGDDSNLSHQIRLLQLAALAACIPGIGANENCDREMQFVDKVNSLSWAGTDGGAFRRFVSKPSTHDRVGSIYPDSSPTSCSKLSTP